MIIGEVNFIGYDCIIEKAQYKNGRIALQLIDVSDSELVTTATVNIPEADLQRNEVLIKDYSENEGMLSTLVNAGIVKETGRRIQSGFVSIPIVELVV